MKKHVFKSLFVLLVVGLLGCVQTPTNTTTVPRYDFVETELSKNILPPPPRDAYTLDAKGSKYRDNDTPYLEDLRRYRDYIDTHIALLEKTTSVGTNRKTTACSAFVLPSTPKLPAFKPSPTQDPNRLLEETADYTLRLKVAFESYLRSVDNAYATYRQTCNL